MWAFAPRAKPSLNFLALRRNFRPPKSRLKRSPAPARLAPDELCASYFAPEADGTVTKIIEFPSLPNSKDEAVSATAGMQSRSLQCPFKMDLVNALLQRKIRVLLAIEDRFG